MMFSLSSHIEKLLCDVCGQAFLEITNEHSYSRCPDCAGL